MRQLPSLKSIQVFESAARLGSFVAAAHELHLTPSAISHHIRSLEERLTVTLFHRVHRRVILTDMGARYAASVGRSLGAIEVATRELERKGRSEVLTVHCVPSLASQWLMPRLSRFSALYPDIDIRINSSVADIDLVAEEADYDICYGAVAVESGIGITPLPAEPLAVICAPGIANGSTPIRSVSDLSHQTLIHSEYNLISWRTWAKSHKGLELNYHRGPRFDRSFMAINAAIDGLGVALESRLLLERELASGMLVAPLGTDAPFMVFHRLRYVESKAHLPKMVVFKEWLFGELDRSFEKIATDVAIG